MYMHIVSRAVLVVAMALGAISVALAEVPALRQGALSRSVLIGDVEFQIYPDRDNKELLYLLPKSLKIARDEKGAPKVSVILVREALEEGRASNGYGYIMMSVTVGPQMTDDLYAGLRKKIAQVYPDLQRARLAPIAFKTGTAEVSFQVLNSGAAATRIPVNAPITLGAEIPLMIPITKEHGAMIHQVSAQAKGATDSRDLGVSISYEAKVTFEVEPTTVKVEAERSEMYKYFQEKKKSGGGFWIFNWSSEREKIREDFERGGYLKGTIRFGDKTLTDAVGGAEYLTGVLLEAKNRAIDFVADINVARTPKEAPMDGYKERPGKTTIYGPNYYWSYTSYFSDASSVVDIQRVSSGKYTEDFTLEGSEDLPVTLIGEDVSLPSNVVSVVSLNDAFYVRELFTGQAFDRDGIWGGAPGRISHALLEVIIGDATGAGSPQIIKFNFDNGNPNTKTVAFWRNARFQRDGSGLIQPVLDTVKVRGEITTAQGGKISVPQKPTEYIPVLRKTDPFVPDGVRLADLFGVATINAENFFDFLDQDCRASLDVSIERPGGGTETVTLKRGRHEAFLPFAVGLDQKSGLEPGTTMRLEAIGRSRVGAITPVPVGGRSEIKPTVGDLPQGWEKVVCGP